MPYRETPETPPSSGPDTDFDRLWALYLHHQPVVLTFLALLWMSGIVLVSNMTWPLGIKNTIIFSCLVVVFLPVTDLSENRDLPIPQRGTRDAVILLSYLYAGWVSWGSLVVWALRSV